MAKNEYQNNKNTTISNYNKINNQPSIFRNNLNQLKRFDNATQAYFVAADLHIFPK